MYKPKITKEEIKLMPKDAFTGEIIVVETEQAVKDTFKIINRKRVVGIDTETKPSFQKGLINKVALLQISTDKVCYLVRLNKVGITKEIAYFFENEKIKKIGLSLKDDFQSLRRRSKIQTNNYIDIQTIAKDYGIEELGLQKIYAILFKKKISKSQRLTNWENDELTNAQKVYAATDAWSVLKIYKKLQKSELINSLK